jgi:hypothetical protein
MENKSNVFLGSMPNWVAVYLAAYITFSLWAFKDDLSHRRLTVMVIFEVIGSVALIVAALAYWYFPFRSFLSGWEAWFFIVGVFTLIVFAAKRVRTTFTDPQLSLDEKIWFSVSGIVFLIFVNLPLIWFGSQFFL